MSRKNKVIFDLDQTLVDSKFLLPLRNANKWQEVMEQVDSVKPHVGAAELLNDLSKEGIKVAIVSNSPRHYCERICSNAGFRPNLLICGAEAVKPKPSPNAIALAVARLEGFPTDGSYIQATAFNRENNYNFESISVGDAWRDIVASQSAAVDTIGAFWDCEDREELLATQPDYIAESIEDVRQILLGGDWNRNRELRVQAEEHYRRTLWKPVDNSSRSHLSNDRKVYYARQRWKGPWHLSHGNSLVNSLKVKLRELEGLPARKYYRDRAATRFARELEILLPRGALVAFVPSSKLEGHPDYCDRNVRVAEALLKLRSDIRIVDALRFTASGEAVHEVDDPSLRDPDLIEREIQCSGFEWTQSDVLYLVDDVLTSGGHLEACFRIFDRNAPGLEVRGAVWALHMGRKTADTDIPL